MSNMPIDLDELAVDFALRSKWTEAIEANNKIIKINPDNVDALNRLARAYFETGNSNKAVLISKKILAIEPNNTIALKALGKYSAVKANFLDKTKSAVTADDFIEEPGKTKTVSLVNLGKESTISCLSSGDEIMIQSHSHKVNVVTFDKKYIGKLPDDLSAKVRLLLKRGGTFKILIKSVDKKNVKVFIKCSKPLGKLKTQEDFQIGS